MPVIEIDAPCFLLVFLVIGFVRYQLSCHVYFRPRLDYHHKLPYIVEALQSSNFLFVRHPWHEAERP